MNTSAALVPAEPIDVGHTGTSEWTPVTTLPNASLWLMEAFQRLRRISDLRDGWDGYGSPAPRPEALSRCLAIMKSLAVDRPAMPLVAPVPGGGIQLEWSSSGKNLEVEILPGGNVQFLAMPGGDQAIEGQLPIADDVLLRSLVHYTLAL